MKQPIKIAIVMVMHYFHPVLEHVLPPSLNLNHNAYAIFPRIHVRCETWHAAQRYIPTLPELSEWTLLDHTFRNKPFSVTVITYQLFPVTKTLYCETCLTYINILNKLKST